jgi:hypothetical protein
MKKLLSLSLAICAVSVVGASITPTLAQAGTTGCWTSEPVGTDPVTVGVAGRTVHVPGVKVLLCDTYYGAYPPSITPRLQPGSCEPSVYDPACFSIYVDAAQLRGVSNVTLEVFIDNQSQPPISVDIPELPPGGSTCVVSVGYRVAPDHACLAFVDLGQ